MKYDPERHHRRSIRLRGYDYSQAGAYFVTICTQDRACLFGDIVDGEMRLNDAGIIVRDEWLRTTDIRSNVDLDAYVVMPNHFHGIIILHPNDGGRGTLQRAPTMSQRAPTMSQRAPTMLQRAPTVEQFGKPTSNTIPTIIRLFKSVCTKRINEMHGTPGAPVWQRNYYERIIRNETELDKIRRYIINNPLNWPSDENYKL